MTNADHERHGYRISTEASDMDVDAIHAYLSRSYWAREIPKAVVAKSVEGSLCFGLFEDAHGLYQKFGFTPVARPEVLMEILRPNMYLGPTKS